MEAYFYNTLAPIIQQHHQYNGIPCSIAKPFHIQTPNDKNDKFNSSSGPDSFTFLLSDLTIGFPEPCAFYSSMPLALKHTKQAIQWLAGFHAIFYNHPILFSTKNEVTSNNTNGGSTSTKNNDQQQPTQLSSQRRSKKEERKERKKAAKNNNNSSTTTLNAIPSPMTDQTEDITVWNQGGYWHLSTRLEELQNISSYDSYLQQCAHAIDDRMKENLSTSSTLVHGDFKQANILFGQDYCAAVDFQYCGLGYGAKDLVMLFISSIPSKILQHNDGRVLLNMLSNASDAAHNVDGTINGEEALLQFYCQELQRNLHNIGQMPSEQIARVASFSTVKQQYELALVDYVRFMSGWGMWGSNCDYAEDRVKEILNLVIHEWSAGKSRHKNVKLMDLSSEEWREAIFERYPLDAF